MQPDVDAAVVLPRTAEGIAARVAALFEQHETEGPAAPVLALGIFERVGSNWLSDSLRAAMPQHNEPFRQQLSRKHPLSPRDRIPLDLTGEAWLGDLELHHLTCALSDLYGRPRHLVKETNLFFAADTVLSLLPSSPALVLTRAPVGIASSFARGRLWTRWAYAGRYAQVAATARTTRWRDGFEPLLPQDDPDEPIALGRLIAVNALLLAHTLARREHTVVSYEQHVNGPVETMTRIAARLDIALPADEHPRSSHRGNGKPVDATFATTGQKSSLVAELDRHTAELVSESVHSVLSHARQILPAQVSATAAEWLAGDDLYELCEPASRRRFEVRLAPPAQKTPLPVYCPMAQASWRNTLVTNGEMADLLTMLHSAGVPNTQYGTNLLVCPMPHERGGRLHFDPKRRRWLVSSGYEAHPAYWVTWVGAATMAAWSGARLPTRDEALEATPSGLLAHNCDYSAGDTSPVAEPGRAAGQVHHMVGNLQIWCGDGPTRSETEPEQRFLFGAAWNTPGTAEAIRAMRSRYLLGSSRGVGVRLVRDRHTTQATGLGAWELAHRINTWIDGLGAPDVSLGKQDRVLVTALTGTAAGS